MIRKRTIPFELHDVLKNEMKCFFSKYNAQ